jgi:hypothetical protein
MQSLVMHRGRRSVQATYDTEEAKQCPAHTMRFIPKPPMYPK